MNENQVIVLEDLNVKGMIKNKKLARSIADVSWSTFVTYVSYKANWANKKLVLINRFFASSKQCNECREKNTMLSLSDREWVCPNCGTKCDRDVNAAKNIKEEGIRLLQNLPILVKYLLPQELRGEPVSIEDTVYTATSCNGESVSRFELECSSR